VSPDSLAVTGLGAVTGYCDPVPFLRVRKQRKFMGVQDDLAVVAAGRAIESAGLPRALGQRAGLYMAVGYIPFERIDMDELLKGSVDERGAFSMARFSTVGYESVNPLLTFRCLSNMPAYHVSANFDVQGPYVVTYPGAGQFYLALEEACAALKAGTIDVALVAGVAHQKNFLVQHHFARLDPPADRIEDAAACLVLERAPDRPARAHLRELAIAYEPHNPFEETTAPRETGADPAMGPASLAVALCGAKGTLRHELVARDGIRASSTWELA